MDEVKRVAEGLNPSGSQRENMETGQLSSPDQSDTSQQWYKQAEGDQHNPSKPSMSY